MKSTEQFQFMMTQRLQCTQCRKVRYSDIKYDSLEVPVPAVALPTAEDGTVAYKPVSLNECLQGLLQEETIEGFRCPGCAGQSVLATKYVPWLGDGGFLLLTPCWKQDQPLQDLSQAGHAPHAAIRARELGAQEAE